MFKPLKELLAPLEYTSVGKVDGEYQIDAVEYDSRKVTPSSFFFCLPGAKADGHDYAGRAYVSGCRVFAVERQLDLPDDAVQIIVQSTRHALSLVSAAFYSFPAKKLTVIGITGTKGKTTTSILIEEIMSYAGKKCAYIGSNGVKMGAEHYDTVNTTPESRELHRFFSMMVGAGFTHVVMEVSSQALDRYRVSGIEFDTVIYTNLSPDHISPVEHSTFEEYREAKHKLFTYYGAKNMVYNSDDANSGYMCSGVSAEVNMISYAVEKEADFSAEDIRPYRDKTSLGIDFDVVHGGIKTGVRLRTPGTFSVYNALAAISTCSIYGVTVREASDCLKNVSIRGRSEIVDALDGITFIVDYAHNGLSLTDELTVLRSYEPKRLICLFGCIGGRTYGRRRELAQAAGKLADFTIVTSDNPDNEDPDEIIRDVLTYFDTTKPYVTITDREEAIRFAVNIADEGDIVLFAGKGHETYQIIHGEKVPFSERSIILNEAAKIKGKVKV